MLRELRRFLHRRDRRVEDDSIPERNIEPCSSRGDARQWAAYRHNERLREASGTQSP
jgi:hypothetical protein